MATQRYRDPLYQAQPSGGNPFAWMTERDAEDFMGEMRRRQLSALDEGKNDISMHRTPEGDVYNRTAGQAMLMDQLAPLLELMKMGMQQPGGGQPRQPSRGSQGKQQTGPDIKDLQRKSEKAQIEYDKKREQRAALLGVQEEKDFLANATEDQKIKYERLQKELSMARNDMAEANDAVSKANQQIASMQGDSMRGGRITLHQQKSGQPAGGIFAGAQAQGVDSRPAGNYTLDVNSPKTGPYGQEASMAGQIAANRVDGGAIPTTGGEPMAIQPGATVPAGPGKAGFDPLSPAPAMPEAPLDPGVPVNAEGGGDPRGHGEQLMALLAPFLGLFDETKPHIKTGGPDRLASLMSMFGGQ
jgi:hypothetical protein